MLLCKFLQRINFSNFIINNKLYGKCYVTSEENHILVVAYKKLIIKTG